MKKEPFNLQQSDERFRPVANTRPDRFRGKVVFFGRMLADLQVLTVYRDLRRELPCMSGKILDVGCGDSPYRHLLAPNKTQYVGMDIVSASKFDYNGDDIVHFNGEDIPFDDETFDAFICTEVLEHVDNFTRLISEMHRVLKQGGRGVITVPWSARYHYIPYDFYRFTPSSLSTIFAAFSEVEIKPRGTDISAIASKLVVLWARNLLPKKSWQWILVPLWVLLLPVPIIAVFFAHVSLFLGWGATEDPLGYTILVHK
jgi:ubiquinone/menaquinone biosynthesis C-methylase UbiE